MGKFQRLAEWKPTVSPSKESAMQKPHAEQKSSASIYKGSPIERKANASSFKEWPIQKPHPAPFTEPQFYTSPFVQLFFPPTVAPTSITTLNAHPTQFFAQPLMSIDYYIKPPPISSGSITPAPEERNKNDKYPLPKRLTLRHVEGWGEGIGFGTDYSTFAALFAPVYRLEHTLPMIDLRVHRFDNNTYAANFGLAARYIPGPSAIFEEILGFNAFYDYREGMKGNYSQIGLGLEVLGRRWDFRANGFAPIGVKKHKTKCVYDQYTDDYYQGICMKNHLTPNILRR